MRFAFLLALALAACDPGVRLGAPCEFSSDCPAELVCGHGRCRIACRVSRDCGPGLRCVQSSSGTPVCTLDQDRSCTTATECSGDLVCSGGECRARCELGCSAEGRCEDGTCVEPRSGEDAGAPPADAPPPDAPPPSDGTPRDCGARLVCGDGILQGCEGDQQTPLMRAILGHEGGELAPFAPATITGITTPRTSTAALTPQIAIAGTASGGAPGLGLVAWIDGAAGETERLGRMRRFPLDDLGGASDLVVPGDAIRGARTVVLAEDGISIAGFWVADTPMPSPGTGAWVTHYAGDMLYVYPLTSGDPASDGFPRSAIVGGASAMLATNFDLFMINREDPPLAVTSERIFGAVDRERAASTYRVITTEAFSSADVLETAGSPGPLMVTRDPAGSRLAVWQVARSGPIVPGEDPADRPPVQQLDVPPGEIGGPPTIALASATGTDHVIGFPTPTGDLRFVRVICPAMADCGATVPFATQASFASGPTRLVRLARVDSGYAYAALAETIEGAQLLHLAFMDESGASLEPFDPGTGVPGDLIPAGDVTGGAIVDVAIHAVRGADAITILVAALIRDDARHLDTVWIGGLRACEAP